MHRRAGFAVCLASAWLLSIAGASVYLWSYENAPGERGLPAAAWPAEVPFARSTRSATLIVALHPRCPCSKATVEELSRVAARANGRFEAHALFYRPARFSKEWSRDALWRAVERIPGVRAWDDEEGRVAKRLGALTSGHVFVYDPAGRIVFNGGITSARGHYGDNAGSDAIIALLNGRAAQLKQTFVYGCSLSSKPTRGGNG